MKIEIKNGVQYIVLDANDKVCITNKNFRPNEYITVTSGNNGLKIDGSANAIESITGEDVISKVSIPPVFSREEIIEKCDEWISQFKKIHDIFKNIVLSREYAGNELTMVVSFGACVDKMSENRSIDLSIKQGLDTIKQGVSINISNNEAIFDYLAASVLDYYVSSNFDSDKIEYDKDFDGFLSPRLDGKTKESSPLFAKVYTLINDIHYNSLYRQVITLHNMGDDAEQLIDSLRNNIHGMVSNDEFDHSIDYSTDQYEHIMRSHGSK